MRKEKKEKRRRRKRKRKSTKNMKRYSYLIFKLIEIRTMMRMITRKRRKNNFCSYI
jgi:hypothetical protein